MTALATLLAFAALTSSTARADTTITFSESTSSMAGWNGQTNDYLTSSDGLYRVEFFWLSTSGHHHISSGVEANHNQAYATGTTAQLQGVRIRRVDGAAFKLKQMDLYGQAAVGALSSTSSGAGAFTLYSNYAGSMYAPTTTSFGASFSGVTSIFIADAYGAGGGGSSTSNGWDNIVLGASTDADGDGHNSYADGGDDCDDADSAVYTGAPELCDGKDNDCDGATDEGVTTTWYADADSDTYGDLSTPYSGCTLPAGYVTGSSDCDDTDSSVHPGATEVCNSVDDDCDGVVDDGVGSTWYADADGDTYGDPASSTSACTLPAGYVTSSTDCDDTDAGVYPGATEYCDDLDNDCDGTVDDTPVDRLTWYRDADSDTFGDATYTSLACDEPVGYVADDTDCDDTDATIYPGAAETAYDGIDQDCDGTDVSDADGDGFSATYSGGSDCNDNDAGVYPGATESADGVDADCDGDVDEGTAWYDDDGDGYTEDGGDCDDGVDTVNPAAVEVEDGIDQDCNGKVDDHTDAYDDDGDGVSEDDGDCNDGDAAQSPTRTEISDNGIDDDCDGAVDGGVADPDNDGYTADGGDCGETDGTVHPGAEELADALDNDCDGLVDEGTVNDDTDGDGATETQGDCNDGDATVGPDAAEITDGIDNDCDDDVDEGTDVFDDDGDGYTEQGGDCDDDASSVHPAAEETLNGIDDDCDDAIDGGVNDADADGYTLEAGDCDDNDGWANPGLDEMCDGADNNCDGEIDENCDGTGTTPPSECGCGTDNGAGALGVLATLAGLATLRRRRRAQVVAAAAAASVAVGCGGDYNIQKAARRVVVSPSLVDLGDVGIGTVTEFDLTVTATGGTDAAVVSVTVLDLDGDGVAWVEEPLPDLASGEGTLHFTYTADDDAWDRARITVQTNEENNNEHTVEVRAHAGTIDVNLWPRVLDLGPVAVGTSGSGSFLLENGGAIPLDVATFAFDNGVFTTSATLPISLDPGDSAPIPVGFTPIATGLSSGQLTITFSDGTTVAKGDLVGNNCAAGSADLYDADGDGYGGCSTDCDDTNASVHPGAGEVCDTVDQDCDGVIDETTSCYDDDGDGVTEDAGDCNDADVDIHPGAADVAGNGRDDDCDGVVDQGSVDDDGDGSSTYGGDCDDADATSYVGAPELLDGIDNDCDGVADEGTIAYDDDGDGWMEAGGDCDDTNADTWPGAPELPDWEDNSCDGRVDEDTVNYDDDYDGYTETGGDCDDANSRRNPGVRDDDHDGVDDDCDGIVDG